MCILSALPRGTSTRTTVWTRAGRRRSARGGGKRLPLPPAAALSSSTKNLHPHYGLDPGRREEKRRRKKRKAATSPSSSSQLILEEPAPSIRSGPGQEGEEAQEKEEEGRYVYQQQLSAHPRGTSTLTTVWTRARRRRSTGKRGGRPLRLPAAAR